MKKHFKISDFGRKLCVPTALKGLPDGANLWFLFWFGADLSAATSETTCWETLLFVTTLDPHLLIGEPATDAAGIPALCWLHTNHAGAIICVLSDGVWPHSSQDFLLLGSWITTHKWSLDLWMVASDDLSPQPLQWYQSSDFIEDVLSPPSNLPLM